MSAYVARRVAAEIGRQGETMTLRRPGTPNIDVTVKAVRIGSGSTEIVGGATRTSFKIRLSNSEIAAQGSFTLPIRPGSDFIVDSDAREYVIEEVDTKRPQGVVAMHVLRVTG